MVRKKRDASAPTVVERAAALMRPVLKEAILSVLSEEIFWNTLDEVIAEEFSTREAELQFRDGFPKIDLWTANYDLIQLDKIDVPTSFQYDEYPHEERDEAIAEVATIDVFLEAILKYRNLLTTALYPNGSSTKESV